MCAQQSNSTTLCAGYVGAHAGRQRHPLLHPITLREVERAADGCDGPALLYTAFYSHRTLLPPIVHAATTACVFVFIGPRQRLVNSTVSTNFTTVVLQRTKASTNFSHRKMSRIPKLLPHLLFPGRLTVYFDAKLQLTARPHELAALLTHAAVRVPPDHAAGGLAPFVAFQHPCVGVSPSSPQHGHAHVHVHQAAFALRHTTDPSPRHSAAATNSRLCLNVRRLNLCMGAGHSTWEWLTREAQILSAIGATSNTSLLARQVAEYESDKSTPPQSYDAYIDGALLVQRDAACVFEPWQAEYFRDDRADRDQIAFAHAMAKARQPIFAVHGCATLPTSTLCHWYCDHSLAVQSRSGFRTKTSPSLLPPAAHSVTVSGAERRLTMSRSAAPKSLADTVVLWTATGAHRDNQGQMTPFAAKLFASIHSVLRFGDASSAFAYVLATITSRQEMNEGTYHAQNISCSVLRKHFADRECNQLAVQSLRFQHVAVSTEACIPGPRSLRAGSLFVLPLDDSRALQPLLSSLRSFVRLSNAYNVSMRPDLASGVNVYTNNVRLVADRLLMPFGVTNVLYLDADTCVRASLSPLLLHVQQQRHAVVAAKRYPNGTTWDWDVPNRSKMVLAPELELIHRHWGFNRTRHQFNAGVMLISLRAWCRRRLFTRITEVARYHAQVHRLFQKVGGSNQPYVEVALAKYVHLVDQRWNCRPRWGARPGADNQSECFINHHRSCSRVEPLQRRADRLDRQRQHRKRAIATHTPQKVAMVQKVAKKLAQHLKQPRLIFPLPANRTSLPRPNLNG